MKDKKEKIINYLIDNADPSILLRIKKEVLNDLSKKEENDFLNKIVNQKNIQTVIQSQKPDGWFGNSFHGQSPTAGSGMYDNMEVGLRYLAEKGLYLARSSIIIRAGYEHNLVKNDFIDLKYDIDFSFNTFSNVLNYISLDDVVDTNRKNCALNKEYCGLVYIISAY